MPTSTSHRYETKVPRYVKLAEDLRRQIEEGKYKPGDQMPSFLGMRTEHGVAQGQLERAYALLEEDGLIRRFTGRGTFVLDPGSKPLTHTIVLVLPMIDVVVSQRASHYFLPLLGGIQAGLQAKGYRLLLVDEWSDTDLTHCDGVVVVVGAESHPLRRLPSGVPVVSVIYQSEGIPSVTSDDPDGIRQAVRHLLDLGHRKIGYLTDTSPFHAMRRLRAYHETMEEAGIAVPLQWIFQQDVNLRNPPEWGYAMMNRWLDQGWSRLGCTALLAYNDGIAVGAIKALQEAGLRVPEDVSVVGFDSTEWCDYVTPRLTSVEVPLKQLGQLASDLLLTRIRTRQGDSGNQLVESMVLPTRLVVRQSTAAPRAI